MPVKIKITGLWSSSADVAGSAAVPSDSKSSGLGTRPYSNPGIVEYYPTDSDWDWLCFGSTSADCVPRQILVTVETNFAANEGCMVNIQNEHP